MPSALAGPHGCSFLGLGTEPEDQRPEEKTGTDLPQWIASDAGVVTSPWRTPVSSGRNIVAGMSPWTRIAENLSNLASLLVAR